MAVHPDGGNVLGLGNRDLSLTRDRAAAPAGTMRGRRTLEELVSGQERFSLHTGFNFDESGIRGYYVDFREKAMTPEWPPPWAPWPGYHRFMGVAQWGLASFERHLAGEGDAWLRAAVAAGEHLLCTQEDDGGWAEPLDQRHTFRLQGPWLSAMAQGQSASLLVRLAARTGDARFAEAALLGLLPTFAAAEVGGTTAYLNDSPFPEEYPTAPPSFVLNGGIFALWGWYDVWRGLGDDRARIAFEAGARGLALNLHRWDTGYWSLYDLYPHRLPNVASGFYHALHVSQLRALVVIRPDDAFERTLRTWEGYAARPRNRLRALAHKVAFRAVVTRARTAERPSVASRRRPRQR